MDPLVPDWRTLGGAPEAPQGVAPTAPAAAGARYVPVTPRVLGAALAAILGAAMTGALACLLFLPGDGSVVIGSAMDPGGVLETAVGTSVVPAASVSPVVDLVVDVEGAVRRPGLVHLRGGARVGDALTLAGGFAPTADLSRVAAELNLAQLVADGLKVIVPAIGDAPPAAIGGASEGGPSVTGKGSGGGSLVDLNHATEAELDALPGVGPATIAKIVAARASEPFRSPDDLRTRGIVGDAVLTKLRPLVTVGR